MAQSDTEEDPWKKKIVLTLDGGGVRGYGSLLMLKKLMEEVERLERIPDQEGGPHNNSFAPYPPPKENPSGRTATDSNEDATATATETPNSPPVALPSSESPVLEELLRPSLTGFLPCHYFDYIGGTSTGGLSAVMLGRLRMSVKQCVDAYPSMVQQIFSHPHRFQFKGWPREKYEAKQIEDAVDKIVGIRTDNGNGQDNSKSYLKTFASPDDLCRTFVVAKKRDVKGIADSLHVFRTYDNTPVAFHPDDELGPASEAPIQKVCRATSAAPTYFDEVMIDKTYYYDGGLGYNNPAGVGHTELAHKEGAVASRSPHVPIRVFVSIGTGGKDEAGPRSAPATTQPQSPKEGKRKRGKMWMHKHYGDLIHRLEKNAVEVLRVDKDMRTKSTMGGWPYFRWTGGEELALIRLDKWKKANKDQPSPTQTKIEGYIDAYMQNRNEEISRVAKILVETRRKRVRHENGDMWQRFTYCSQFACHCKTDKWQDLATVRRLTAHLQSHNGTIWDMSTVSRHGPEIVGGPR